MTLKKYLDDLGIDQIEDDDLFMGKEYDAVYDYCEERNFNISEEDMDTIIGRGLEDSFHIWSNY